MDETEVLVTPKYTSSPDCNLEESSAFLFTILLFKIGIKSVVVLPISTIIAFFFILET